MKTSKTPEYIHYIKDKKQKKVGCLIAKQLEGANGKEIFYGWSLCNPKFDRFSKKEAKKEARRKLYITRAKTGKQIHLPDVSAGRSALVYDSYSKAVHKYGDKINRVLNPPKEDSSQYKNGVYTHEETGTKVVWQYIKENGVKRGIVAAYFTEAGQLLTGWSLCNPKDRFSIRKGFKHLHWTNYPNFNEKLESLSSATMFVVCEALNKISERASRYFKKPLD